MNDFIEVTSAFTGEKMSIRKDLILSFKEYHMRADASDRVRKVYEDKQSIITIKLNRIDQRFGEKESHVLSNSTVSIRESYAYVKTLMKGY